MARYSPSKLPKAITHYPGQCTFAHDAERIDWVKDFIEFARQKLIDTKRWQNKDSLLKNVSLLTPAELERLTLALNVRTYYRRADKKATTRCSAMAQAKILSAEYDRLLNGFFEGKLRVEKKKTVEEILNG